MVRFLTLSEVLIIYEDQVRRYGGEYGVRDLNLLSSAVYVPQSSFNGEYLHTTVPAMAAAYGFHICQNHPFVDGNKRTALASALVFLDLNNYDFTCPEPTLYKQMMDVAKGEIKKESLITFFEKYAKTAE
ncbi:type II toxin-antitoxin system death-on-curing family toxin [Breznakiella homolactica]|uniref:Type II toxin-antitoxin system death-on-curing family toxin n=1 Tax=Breznakiella homolactica TaxID=2798577 RepID=A0A7T7XJW1_9SPIR|nr:type II toxin-antitoxin system death-on-curing family toxin [Breznakiella homolactica]QQO07572.1 type II toxin-antitoxin system death-on-curing family toxin [Breznakiella homolactica]